MDPISILKDISETIERRYDAENDVGKPLVTITDNQLREAVSILTDLCWSLRERVRELEQRESARMQLEEEERLRE